MAAETSDVDIDVSVCGWEWRVYPLTHPLISRPPLKALGKYVAAVGIQMTVISAALAALDVLVGLTHVEVPSLAVTIMFFGLSLKSRVRLRQDLRLWVFPIIETPQTS